MLARLTAWLRRKPASLDRVFPVSDLKIPMPTGNAAVLPMSTLNAMIAARTALMSCYGEDAADLDKPERRRTIRQRIVWLDIAIAAERTRP